MKTRYLLPAIAMGLGLVVVLLLVLAHSTTIVRADPGIYYVREGATGDCLSTTTPCGSVQQAINMAAVLGDEVWVTTGIYTENLGITHSVELRGGWNVSFTMQNPISTATTLDGGGEHNVRVEDTPPGAQITIEGLTLRNGQDGVHIWTGNVSVERCTILNMNKQGFEIDGGTVSISATQILTTQQGIEVDDGTVWATDVHVVHTSEEGVLIEGGGTITVTGSTVEDCTQQGIQIDQGDVWLFDNDIHDVISDAIHVNGGSVSVVSNTIHAIQSDGIDVQGSQVISGNLVYHTANRGIYAHDGILFGILNNTVRDTDRDAIRTANGMTVLVQGNTITNAGNDGIDARGVSVNVTDNRIYSTWDRGINAEDGALTIVGNVVRNPGGDGIRTAGSSTEVEIRSNVVYTAGNDGIDGRGDAIAISHNTVRGCADNGIRSEGDVRARIEVNRILDNGIGIAIRGAPTFTITNNVIADHITASVELTGTGSGVLYHNTLVGSSTGVQGTGLAVPDPLIVTLVNNIVVSHNVSISATAGATLVAHNTLLWANGDDPVGGSAMIPAPPLFVNPAQQDYHLLPGSPAIEGGIAGTGVTSDMDGEPRPIGPLPDVGADEFPAGLNVIKQVDPIVVQPGAPLTYTIRITNTGLVTLTTTITDTLPDHVSPTGTRTWTATLTPTAVWMETVVVTVEAGYVGPLVNVVRAMTDEGAAGVYTHTLAPDLAVTKRADPNLVKAGERLTYTIHITNTGNFDLNATITDTLPVSITLAQIPGGTTFLPGEQVVWMAFLPAPDGVWTGTVVVTVAEDYAGPLTNVVQVTTDEGVTGVYVAMSTVLRDSIYLPLVVRNY